MFIQQLLQLIAKKESKRGEANHQFNQSILLGGCGSGKGIMIVRKESYINGIH